MKRLVYVSGAPGAGKTTLAGPPAEALGYALITKDTIKETLHCFLLLSTPREDSGSLNAPWRGQ